MATKRSLEDLIERGLTVALLVVLAAGIAFVAVPTAINLIHHKNIREVSAP